MSIVSLQVLLNVVPRMTYSLADLIARHHESSVRTAASNLLTLMWTSHGAKFDHLLTEMEPLPDEVLELISTEVELPSLAKVCLLLHDSGSIKGTEISICQFQGCHMIEYVISKQ